MKRLQKLVVTRLCEISLNVLDVLVQKKQKLSKIISNIQL